MEHLCKYGLPDYQGKLKTPHQTIFVKGYYHLEPKKMCIEINLNFTLVRKYTMHFILYI